MEPTYKSYVLELLENSSHRLRQIELMRYEFQHIPQVSDSEMIEAMSLPSLTSSEKAASSKAVPDVALSYKRTAEKMNAETLSELASAYMDLWREHDRLLHYIGLLDERQRRVLQLYYVESYVWTDVAKAMHMTVRTAQRIRQQAVDELAKLYAFADSFFKL
mgnify:FL=1